MPSPRFPSRMGKLAALVAATLILPILAYAGNGQAVGRVPRYTVTDIGFLPGITAMYPVAINIHGDVVGTGQAGVRLPGIWGAIFLYTNGQLSDLFRVDPVLPGIVGQAIGINAQKEAVARFYDYEDSYGWIFGAGGGGGGEWTVVSYGFSIPTGINDVGQIIGSYYDYYPAATGYFLFTPNAPLIQLSFYPTAINNLAQIAGDGVVITQPGGSSPQYLGNLGGPAYATGINILGQIVGYSATTTENNSPVFGVLYSEGKVINLGLPKGETAPQYQSFATGINDLGVIVGYSDLAGVPFGTPSSNARGLVYVKGQWYDLNDLLNATGKGLTITEATGINNVGQIIATALDAAGNQHAVILTVVGFQ